MSITEIYDPREKVVILTDNWFGPNVVYGIPFWGDLPTTLAGYPLENLYERDSNVITRFQNDQQPLAARDALLGANSYLGFQKPTIDDDSYVDGVAICNIDVGLDGGAYIVLPHIYSFYDFPLDNDDEGIPGYIPLVYNLQNLIVNGDGQYIDFSSGTPQTLFYTQFARSAPYIRGFYPPPDPSGYIKRAGIFTSNGLAENNCLLSQWSHWQEGSGGEIEKEYGVKFWYTTWGETLDSVGVSLLFFDKDMFVVGRVDKSLGTIQKDSWEFYEDVIKTTPPFNTAYIALGFSHSSSGKRLFTDFIRVYETKNNCSGQFVKTEKQTNVSFMLTNPILSEFALLAMKKGGTDDFVGLGNIILSRGLQLDLNDSVGYNFNPSRTVTESFGGTPVELYDKPPEETFVLNFRTWTQVEADSLLDLLTTSIRNQLFLSMFNNDIRYRSMLCHLTGNLSSSESLLKDYRVLSATFRREGAI